MLGSEAGEKVQGRRLPNCGGNDPSPPAEKNDVLPPFYARHSGKAVGPSQAYARVMPPTAHDLLSRLRHVNL